MVTLGVTKKGNAFSKVGSAPRPIVPLYAYLDVVKPGFPVVHRGSPKCNGRYAFWIVMEQLPIAQHNRHLHRNGMGRELDRPLYPAI